MTEAVVEEVEVEAGAEEVFEFWSDLRNVCALVRKTEESRRVDLSESLWSFRGPAGRSAQFGPDAFGGCLRHRRWGHEMAGPSSPDLLIGDVFVDFKAVSPDKTLLFLSYAAGEGAAEGGTESEGPASEGGTPSGVPRDLYLDLHAILTKMYSEAYEPRSGPSWGPAARAGRDAAPQEQDGVISLLEEWSSEDPAYDEETMPALKENLNRNRPDYRKPFDLG